MTSRTSAVTRDASLIGRQATVRRVVTALRPTREWTGARIWEGKITDAARDAATGELRAVCLMTADQHTWLSLGDAYDRVSGACIVPASPEHAARHWSTVIELL